MMLRYVAILGLIGVLAGCDGADVIGMERRVFTNAKDLARLPDDSGLWVEIHGAPWPGATPDQIANTMHMPDGVAKAVRFRAIRPGDRVIGGDKRLVLHFNPTGKPNHIADCQAEKEFQTEPPETTGFTVNATYCRKGQWEIHAFLKANAVGQDDWFAYTMAMRKLLGKLFPEE